MKKILLLFLAIMGGTFFSVQAVGLPGDSLADPILVSTLPYSNINRTDTCYTNQYVGRAGNDVYYQFTTGACSNGVTISTCSDTTDFDTYVYILDDQGNQIAFNDDAPSGTCNFTLNGLNRFSVININLAPASTYYVVVDGWGATDEGTYELSISEAPYPGDSLQDPIAIGPLPYLDLNNTGCFSNQYVGRAGRDAVYALVTSACTDSLFISTCSDSTDFDTYVYLLDTAGNVIALNDDSPSGTCNLTLNGNNRFSVINAPVSPNTPYFIVVDGWGAGDFGQYELSVSESVTPVSGDSLADPIAVPGLPFNTNGSTAGCYSNQFNGQGSNDVFYQFQTGPCTDTVTVSTCSPLTFFDTYIHLLDSAGNVIAFNDDAAGGTCSFTLNGLNRFSTIVQAVNPNSTYYVVVEGFGATNAGSYDLTISENGPTVRDNLAAAQSITFPYNTIDSTDCNTDAFQGRVSPDQFFTFTTGSCAPVITISTCSDTTNFDTYVYLLDTAGAVVAQNDDSPAGTCSSTLNGFNRFSVIETPTMPNTTYYIVVDGFGAADFGRFELNVTAALPSGDSLADPIVIPGLPYVDINTNGGCYTDQFQGRTSEVFYQVNTSSCTDSLTISTCSDTTDFDTYIYLLDTAGAVIAFNDDSPTGTCNFTLNGLNRFSVINADVDPNSTYYVVVDGFGVGAEGLFELSVSETQLPIIGDSLPTAIAIPSLPYTDIRTNGDCFTDQFQGRSSDVFYSFTTSSCIDSVRISTCSDTTDFDTYIYLLDTAGNVLESNDDAAPGTCGFTLNGLNRFSVIDAEVDPNTTYYVVIDGFGSGDIGLYELNVTEILDSLTITVNNSSGPTCAADTNGSISITVTGGTPPYTFDWGNGITDEDPTGLLAGTYTVMVSDSAGCMGTGQAVTLTAPTALAISIDTSTDILCDGDSTGSIRITVTGGTPPYTYDWGNGITDEDPIGLMAGTYTVMVTDSNGCMESGTPVTITAPMPLAITVDNSMDVLCNGDTTGSISITVTGGTAPYTYDWGNGITDEDPTGLTAGTYTVMVTDSNGCMESGAPVTIAEPAALTASTVVTDETVPNAMDGSVVLTVGGGVTPYTFLWDNGATTQDLTGVAGGGYCYTVTDANGCVIEGCDSVGTGVSLDVNPALSHLNIYPNPTSGIAIVDLATYQAMDVEIELVNGLGNVLYTEKASDVSARKFQLDLNEYSQGVYYVRVKVGTRIVSRSLILTR